GLAKPIIDRVVNADVSKWDPVNLLFATTRGKVASTGWLTESVMTKILDHVRSENADSPGAIPWFLVTVLKYAKDDEALQQRAIELFSNEYAKVYAQEPGIKFSILEDLINSNVGDPLFNGPDFLDLPISVTLQDRLVDIMEKAG
ncbi:MAG TPA: hypothetical protein VNI20_01710, partial [Fimbriimonadaceae bacterium]|nr:hypothetical protein [Fimbriimonadaceae bacterium]